MSEKKTVRIFMMLQNFPCGEQSSCCGPIGQSEKEIQNLKSSIENELGYQVEVLNVKNDDDIRNHPRIVQLLHSFGPAALPIIALEDEVVSMGNLTPEKAVAEIRKNAKKKTSGKENKMIDNDNTGKAGKENLEDSRACCPSASGSGDCYPTTPGGRKGWKIVVCILIVVAAGVVLARSVISKSNSATDQIQQSFAAIQPEAKADTSSALNATAKSDKAAPTLWGPELDSLASLNQVAASSDAVFVFLAADDQQANQTVTKEIDAAAKKIQAGGVLVSAFRLNKGAQNYAQVASQLSLPCVLAMVKGRGVSGVSGQITETKLIQAFVAASRPASGCGPSGCGPVGCP